MGDSCSVLGVFGIQVKAERQWLIESKRCPLGHVIAGENLIRTHRGHAACLVCQRRRRMRTYYAHALERYWLHSWPESTVTQNDITVDDSSGVTAGRRKTNDPGAGALAKPTAREVAT